MECPHGQSVHTNERPERTELGYRRLRCRGCQREFNERTGPPFNRLQYPSDVGCLVVLWRLRYKLSLRDLAEMFLEGGFVFTHETVGLWAATFAPLLTERQRKHRYGQGSRRRHVDETLTKVNGKWVYLYRALDHEGNLLDVRLSETCGLLAVRPFFRSARMTAKRSPPRLISDRHGSYPGAIRLEFGPAVIHQTRPYSNNLLEQSHRAVKQRLLRMLGFKRTDSAARFCHTHDDVRNFLRVLLRSRRPVPLSWQRQLHHHQFTKLNSCATFLLVSSLV
jgi:putative transposase